MKSIKPFERYCTNGDSPREDLEKHASKANYHTAQSIESHKTTLEHAKLAGEHLIAAKKALAHGEWGKWLLNNYSYSRRTAQVFMRVADKWDELEKDDKESVNMALRALTDPREQPEPDYGDFNPHEYSKYQAIKEFLKRSFREWTEQELNHLTSNLWFEREYREILQRLMGELKALVQRDVERDSQIEQPEPIRPENYLGPETKPTHRRRPAPSYLRAIKRQKQKYEEFDPLVDLLPHELIRN